MKFIFVVIKSIILVDFGDTHDMLTILLRTLIIYFVLVFAIRLMGKRQIGELQVSEFIVSIILSEIAAGPITNRAMPLLHAVVPILILLSVEVMISFILLKSNRLKRLFYGTPSIVIRKGQIVQSELKRNRLEVDELISELRQKGFSDPSDVYYAVLEENGQLSVFPTADKAPLTPNDMKCRTKESGLAHVCIVDGQVIEKNLALAGLGKDSLQDELKKRSAALEEVFLMTVDDSGKITLIRKDNSTR